MHRFRSRRAGHSGCRPEGRSDNLRRLASRRLTINAQQVIFQCRPDDDGLAVGHETASTPSALTARCTTARANGPAAPRAVVAHISAVIFGETSAHTRRNADVGITPIMPMLWLCRCAPQIPRTVGLPCVSGRHNPDVITVLTLGHCRGRAVWRGPHQQSSRRRSRAGTSCRRGHRCPQGLDRPSHPCHRSRRRPRAP
jgi:hypothetical protein